MIAATGGAHQLLVLRQIFGVCGFLFISICDVRKWEVMTDDVSLPFPNIRQQQ